MAKRKRMLMGFDFETANLPEYGEVAFPVEVAVQLIDAHTLETVAKLQRFIRLADGVEMTQEALDTHGYTPEFLAENGRNFWDVRGDIINWLAREGYPAPDGGGWDKERTGSLIPFGQNVLQFDLPIMRKLLSDPAHRILSRFAVDTMLIADFINQAAFRTYGWDGFIFRDPSTGNPSSNLASQMAALQIPAKGHHGAAFDIEATRQCYVGHIVNYSDDLQKSAAFTAAGLTLPPLPRY